MVESTEIEYDSNGKIRMKILVSYLRSVNIPFIVSKKLWKILLKSSRKQAKVNK